MAERQVAIRLATSGKAEVKNDFAEMGAAGKTAFDGIGNAGDAAARKASTAFDRASEEVQRSVQRQANAAAKLAAITPQSPTQFRINDTVGTGFGEYEGSARRSAAAIRELIAEQERFEARAAAIRNIIDPLAAVQDRYNRELAEARTLMAAGALTAGEFAIRERQLKEALEQSTLQLQRHGVATGNTRMATLQAGQQVQDFAIQVGSGQSVVVAATQQLSQLGFVLSSVGGAAGKFGAFIAGPWGTALFVATTAISLFASRNRDAGDAISKHGEAAKDLTDALRELDQASGRSSLTTQRSIELHIRNAEAKRKDEIQTLKLTEALLVDAQQRMAIDTARTGWLGALQGAAGGPDGLQFTREAAEIERLKGSVKDIRGRIEEAGRSIRGGEAALITNRVREETDAAFAASERFARAEESLQNLFSRGIISREELAASIRKETATRDAAIEAAKKQERSGKDAERAAAKAAREAIRDQRELAQTLREIEERYNPTAAAARRYADTLADIAKLRAAGLIDEGLADEINAAARLQRFDEYQKAMDERRRQTLERAGSKYSGGSTFADFIDFDGIDRDLEREAEKIYAVIDQVGGAMRRLRPLGDEVIDTVLDPQRWRDWGDLGNQVINSIMRDFLMLAAANPLKNLLFGAGLPTLGNFFAPKLAGGTSYWGGGATWVAENGPELINLPRGSSVTPAAETRRLLAASEPSSPVYQTFDLRGAVVYEDLLQRIELRSQQAAMQGAAGGARLAAIQGARAARRSMVLR